MSEKQVEEQVEKKINAISAVDSINAFDAINDNINIENINLSDYKELPKSSKKNEKQGERVFRSTSYWKQIESERNFDRFYDCVRKMFYRIRNEFKQHGYFFLEHTTVLDFFLFLQK